MPNLELIALAESLVVAGKLPSGQASRTFGGLSSGGSCALCGGEIARDSVEIEVETTIDGQRLHTTFHPRCHSAWIVAVSQLSGTCDAV